jgi:hypothetical protein
VLAAAAPRRRGPASAVLLSLVTPRVRAAARDLCGPVSFSGAFPAELSALIYFSLPSYRKAALSSPLTGTERQAAVVIHVVRQVL